MTISEIAKLANVSKTTVSRVINNRPDVDSYTRKTILDIIEKYDYHPNANAKAILQKSRNVGLIIPYNAEFIFENPFFVEVMHGISTSLSQNNYYLVICYPHEQNYLDIYKQKRVDGFIVLSPNIGITTLLDSLLEKNAPFVCTARLEAYKDLASVDIDNRYGGSLAAKHLLSLGHKNVAFIGRRTIESTKVRFEGFEETYRQNGIIVDKSLFFGAEEATLEIGYDMTRVLLEKTPRPTAIFAGNDTLAIGAMSACKDLGLSVPEDIAIIGFDDISFASYVTPSLTTISHPAFKKGVAAAEMIIEYIESNKKPESRTLPIELVVRKTT